MKSKIQKPILAALVMSAVALTSTVFAGEADAIAEANAAITKFQAADTSLKQYFDTAAGYVVFPNVAKGGLVVGGAHGSGVLYEKGQPIGTTKLTQASFGAQAGVQSFGEAIFFETSKAIEDFKGGKFEMGADVSAVAASEGVAKTAKYKDGVMVFALPNKGLMVQASVGGQKFKYEPLK